MTRTYTDEPGRRFRANLRKEAQAINERNRVPGDPHYKEKSPRQETKWFEFKYEHQGVFRFCAQSPHDARAVAGHYVKGATFTIDTTRIVEVVAFVAVDGPVGDKHGEGKR